jgi:hypothetical protein
MLQPTRVETKRSRGWRATPPIPVMDSHGTIDESIGGDMRPSFGWLIVIALHCTAETHVEGSTFLAGLRLNIS